MLAGLAGAALPLVLHLLNRARYRRVEWGAMMFLPTAADARQRRAVRLRQFVLLALRMVAVAMLAVALARPIVSGHTRAGDEHTRTVLLLDCSASMGYSTNGRTRFDAARRAALAVLQSLGPGDEAALFLVGAVDPNATDDVALTTDVRGLADRVAEASVAPARSDLAAALTTALRILDPSRDPAAADARRHIVLLTDQQASSWAGCDNDAFAEAFRRAGATLTVVPVGGTESDNIAVTSVSLAPGRTSLIRDVPDEVVVNVRNFGDVARAGVPVSITSGGREYGRQSVNLAAGASATVRVPVRFDTVGSHVLGARVASAAAAMTSTGGLVADDRIDFAFDVAPPIRVLLLAGEPRTADVIRAALMPYATAGERDGPDPCAVQVMDASVASPGRAIDKGRCDVVISCGGAQVDPQLADDIGRFIFDGGGAIILPDRAEHPIDVQWSPAKLTGRADVEAVEPLGESDTSHPALDFLAGHRDIFRSVRVAYRFHAEPASDARVLMRAVSGEPLLAVRALGGGRVATLNAIVSPSPVGPAGAMNPLPQSAAFLPLMQSLVRWVAGGADATRSDRNLLPNEAVDVVLPDAASDLAQVILPDGSREAVPLVRRQSGSGSTDRSSSRARFTHTRLAGRYEVRYRAGDGDGGAERTVHFVVRVSPEESDLTAMSPHQWTQLLDRLGSGARRVMPAELDARVGGGATSEPRAARAARAPRSVGTDLWAPLVIGVGALLLLECWLGWLWSTRGDAGRA